eukprot:7199829-Alexandrium_andersonii.AAC.1
MMRRHVPAFTLSSRSWQKASSPLARMKVSTACSCVSPAACHGCRPAGGTVNGGAPGGGAA